MKRITALLGCLCMFALFSCKKETATPVSDFSKSTASLGVTTINGVTVNTDTIPPSGSVDVKTYGATGNGVTDDTQAIQNAINAANVITFSKGTYIINKTLSLRSGVKLYGTNGATLKAGTSMSGTLLTCGRFIYASACSKASVINLLFTKASQAFSLGSWSNSCIYITNSQSTTITYNKFNFSQPYQASGIEGVWVSGASSTGTYIGKNIFNTVGIEYAEAGASGTITINNTVNNSHSNAIGGHGNTTTYCTKNQILNNIINNAGYNGINDWGNIDGTIIKANVIKGTGKSPSEGAQGEGIQAVGVNTWVSLNYISDAQAEYIEVKSTNKMIDSNTIVDTKGVTEGIVINCMGAAQANARYTTASINHNSITGCSNSIIVVGNYSPSVDIINNGIYNPVATGINVNSNASSYSVTASGNTINITTPNTGVRKAITSYAGTLTSGQVFKIASNTINYGTGAAGGVKGEYALLPSTNNVTITGNKVNTNSIKSGGVYVNALTSNGSKYSGYTITNNTFTGSVNYDLSGFISAVLSANVL